MSTPVNKDRAVVSCNFSPEYLAVMLPLKKAMLQEAAANLRRPASAGGYGLPQGEHGSDAPSGDVGGNPDPQSPNL